jgi:hypothetical protein
LMARGASHAAHLAYEQIRDESAAMNAAPLENARRCAERPQVAGVIDLIDQKMTNLVCRPLLQGQSRYVSRSR